MISLKCLVNPKKLKVCPTCKLESFCETFCKFLPRLAYKCGIDVKTGRPFDAEYNGFDPDKRQDLFIDTLLGIEKGVSNFNNESQFTTWLESVYKHKLYDLIRKKNKMIERRVGPPGHTDDNGVDDDWITLRTDSTQKIITDSDPLKDQDLCTAIRLCYRELALVDKKCGELLSFIYRRTLQLSREDGYYEKGGKKGKRVPPSINWYRIFKTLAAERGTTHGALKKAYYRCFYKKECGSWMRDCLKNRGYDYAE
jgi:hypothetical protein